MNFNKETKTIKTYLYWYVRFTSFKNKNKFIEFCKENYSISTQRIIISSIKHFESTKFSKSLKMPNGTSRIIESTISKCEYDYILNNLYYESFKVSERNKKIVEVLWNTGMRITELLNLRWRDYTNDYLKVRGKGNKVRVIPIHDQILKEFCIENRNKSMFIFKNKFGDRLSYSSIVHLFKKIKILLDRDDVSAHIIRHSFATRLLKKDIPILYISKLLGHSNISITERYLHWNNEEILQLLKEKDWLC